MKSFNASANDDYYKTSQSNLGAPTTGSQRGTFAMSQADDPMSHDLTYLAHDAPLDGGESTFGAANYSTLSGGARSPSPGGQLSSVDSAELARNVAELAAEQKELVDGLAQDNVEQVQRPLRQLGFLVSFMVDARGGAMRGCRHSGVRVIIPPSAAQMPMRITCRYLRRERLVHPPPLMEGEACASKIVEVGPIGAAFLRPVLIEVPHFASLATSNGTKREVIILRSDNGEVWREHTFDADERFVKSIVQAAELDEARENQENIDKQSRSNQNLHQSDTENGGSLQQQQQQSQRQLTRIVTNEFPQYFAIISRIRQDLHSVGPEGATLNSSAVPKVQAILTEGALTKRIKIGLQNDECHERATSPTKRRSGLFACFRATDGSVDMLEPPALSSSAAQAAATSDDDDRSSAGADSLEGPAELRRSSIVGANKFVPVNYYIEQEPPLILNLEPTTYGKRLTHASAQTDADGKKRLSTRANKTRGKSTSGKRKAQLTIHVSEPTSTVGGAPSGSGGDATDSASQQQKLIDDAMFDTAHNLRSCVVQTDSDSVTVAYVTTPREPSSNTDDGYSSEAGLAKAAGKQKQKEKAEKKADKEKDKQKAAKQEEKDSGKEKKKQKQKKKQKKVELVEPQKDFAEEAAAVVVVGGGDDVELEPAAVAQQDEPQQEQQTAEARTAPQTNEKLIGVEDITERDSATLSEEQDEPPLVSIASAESGEAEKDSSRAAVELSSGPAVTSDDATDPTTTTVTTPKEFKAKAKAEKKRLKEAAEQQAREEKECKKRKKDEKKREKEEKKREKEEKKREKEEKKKAAKASKRITTADKDKQDESAEPVSTRVEHTDESPEERKASELAAQTIEEATKRVSEMSLESIGKADSSEKAAASQDAAPSSSQSGLEFVDQTEPAVSSSSIKNDKHKGKDKKKDKKKVKTKDEKKTKKLAEGPEPHSAATTTTITVEEQPPAKSRNFFSRLFSSLRSKNDNNQTAHDLAAGSAQAANEAPLVVSEMYPQDANDADGELVLEVNVAQEVLDKQQQQQQQSRSETIDSPHRESSLASSTTIDETLGTYHADPASYNQNQDNDDDQKTIRDDPFSESTQQDAKPVHSSSDVQEFVEEVVGDDGIVTKTTKTIETKYVTLRHEENVVKVEDGVPVEELDERGGREPPPIASLVDDDERQEPLKQEPQVELAEQQFSKKERSRLKKLVKRQNKADKKQAKVEAKSALREAKLAQSQIATCLVAAQRANDERTKCEKYAKQAARDAAKAHTKMNKVDKKFAKSAKKLEKNQKKIDKLIEKRAKETAKRNEKAAKAAEKAAMKAEKAADKKRRSPSPGASSSSGKRSIKREDIGEPVLCHTSRVSLTGEPNEAAAAAAAMASVAVGGAAVSVTHNQHQQQVNGDNHHQLSDDGRQQRVSAASDDEVEVNLDDHHIAEQPASVESSTAGAVDLGLGHDEEHAVVKQAQHDIDKEQPLFEQSTTRAAQATERTDQGTIVNEQEEQHTDNDNNNLDKPKQQQQHHETIQEENEDEADEAN